MEYKFDEQSEKEYDSALKDYENIENYNNSLNSKLEGLRDIMRIYLKIEWNKAKKGK